MAKYKLQELNDLSDEGKRRVYPKMVTNRTLSRKEFVKMMQNYHRGISESRCVLRVSILWIAVPITQSINTVNWVYPITWSISTVVLLIYYRKSDWLHSFQREKAE